MSIRPGAIALLLFIAVPSPAQQAAPAPVARVTAALAAKPLDCAAVASAYAALGKAGRQAGDVSVVAAGRRSDAACAHDAADACASALGITSQEVVTWLLRHPEASTVDPAAVLPLTGPAEGEAPALPCGLVPVGRSIVKGLDATALVLSLRNDTKQWITGHDIVLQFDGKPWRGARGAGFADKIAGADTPVGSPDQLDFDPHSQTWEDRRLSEARTLTLDGQRDPPKGFSVAPGALLELSIPLAEGAAPPDPDGIDVQYMTCQLTLY